MLANLSGEANCAPAVKANAYGIGFDICIPALLECGADTFFVAQISEGQIVRTLAPDATIYILSGFVPGSAKLILEAGLRPVISSVEEAEEWRSDGKAHPAALHVDTGINRLGLTPDEAIDLGDNPDFEIALLMSHFACADEPGHPLNLEQIKTFDNVRKHFASVPSSFSNSATLLWPEDMKPRITMDVTRPGIALFGCGPLKNEPNPMAPVARLESRIIQIREVSEGETIGYGSSYTTTRNSRIAILSAGYADGYRRCLGDGGQTPVAQAAIGSTRVPVVGRVSMDLLAVDVTDIKPENVSRGDFVELFGNTVTVDEVAAWSNTISYEVLTGLGARLQRIVG